MKKLIYLGLALAVGFTSCDGTDDPPPAGPTNLNSEVNFVLVTDVNDGGVGTTTWTKDKVYILNGLVFVNEGQTLTIEPGTIIKGRAGQGEEASALIVAKGGKIMASGTAAEPIIFTAEADNTNRNKDGELIGMDQLGLTTAGQWGGLIILGNSGLNSSPGVSAIEGISTDEARGAYGGTNDEDNSGVLRYVSIRHGGTNIGADNEINGLTLGGVGSGTTIEFIEVIANKDDGIEFFGGTARVKYALVANTGDDSFDYDEGYRGFGQFWVSVNPFDRHGEHDGGTNPETAQPYATPTIFNATYIGGSKSKLTFRDNAGGFYNNSIFESFGSTLAVDIEDLMSGDDSRLQFENGRLSLKDNIFANSGTVLVAYTGAETASIADSSNTSQTASLVSEMNPVPATPQVATNLPNDPWFTSAAYKGAFGGANWAQGWTLYYAN